MVKKKNPLKGHLIHWVYLNFIFLFFPLIKCSLCLKSEMKMFYKFLSTSQLSLRIKKKKLCTKQVQCKFVQGIDVKDQVSTVESSYCDQHQTLVLNIT